MKVPESLEELEKYRYCRWGGKPQGTAYDPSRCAEEVPFGGRSPLFHQCCNKNGKGKNGLFCGIHAKWHPA
jgi:hypothetical protein